MFQFSDRAVLPIRVLGRDLRASTKPAEAKVRLESNGGTHNVLVRLRYPLHRSPRGCWQAH